MGCTLLFFGFTATLSHAVAAPGDSPALGTLALLPLGYSIVAASSSFVLALRQRPSRWAYRAHGVAMAAGWIIGLVGALIHAASAGRDGLPLSTLFGSVALAPLTFVAVTSAIDHRAGAWSWTEAIAMVAAVAGLSVVVVMLPGRGSERIKIAYVGVMLSTMLVGFAGLALHLSANMGGPPPQLIGRMVLQAPLMAPLLFGLLGMLGLLAVAEPAVDRDTLEAAWPPRRPRRFRRPQVGEEDDRERGGRNGQNHP